MKNKCSLPETMLKYNNTAWLKEETFKSNKSNCLIENILKAIFLTLSVRVKFRIKLSKNIVRLVPQEC